MTIPQERVDELAGIYIREHDRVCRSGDRGMEHYAGLTAVIAHLDAKHDARVSELLAANNDAVEKRRDAEHDFKALESLMSDMTLARKHQMLDRRDARRWRALLSAPYLGWQGSAGFGHGGQEADQSGYRHFGMTFTSMIKPGDAKRYAADTQRARQVLIDFAKVMIGLVPPLDLLPENWRDQ